MTIPEFVDKLTELKDKHPWMLTQYGAVRYFTDDASTCPIAAVARLAGCNFITAGSALGLTSEARKFIMCAADNIDKNDLRKQILEALDLKEIE